MKGQDLFLFTQSYPFGSGESFIEKEINILSGCFDRIHIFPLNKTGKVRHIPENADVVFLFGNQNYSALKTAISRPLDLLKIYKKEIKGRGLDRADKRYLLSWILQKMAKAKILKDYFEKKSYDKPIFYSYWLADWMEIISLSGLSANIPVVSRAHGFDLYEERHRLGFIPFRNLQLEAADKIFAISKDGQNYLKSKYPDFSDKIYHHYLGVNEEGENPFAPDNVFTIVSCSGIIPLKRVELIIEIIKNISFAVKWIHIGDGEGKENLRNATQTLPENIMVEFKGALANKKVLEFYRNVPVNLFINVSETEGVPVTIMEAISFGIPVMATNVGGVSEIVNEKCGILLEKDFDRAIAAKKIEDFKVGSMNTTAFRKQVKNYWHNKFNAEVNFTDFCDLLVEP